MTTSRDQPTRGDVNHHDLQQHGNTGHTATGRSDNIDNTVPHGKDTEEKDILNGSPTTSAKKEVSSTENPTPQKMSKAKQLWAGVGLDTATLLMMFKGSVSPLIAVAFFQADAVASTFKTIGYLVPIVTILAVPIMPRAKFLQTMFLNVIATCIASAVALLGIWSSLQARLHTSAPPHQGYNSSQSTVCAIWLIFTIWFVNTFKAKVPALQFPVIIFSIVTIVAFAYGPIFTTVAAMNAFVKELLIAFLTAFGIATGVNLFIIPVSSRAVVFKEQAGYIGLIRKTLAAEVAYLQSLESTDMFGTGSEKKQLPESKGDKHKNKAAKTGKTQSPQTLALRGSVDALIALHGKLDIDLPFGKREVAYGKLDANDIQELSVRLRAVFIPLTGLSTIADIFGRLAEHRGWSSGNNSEHDLFEDRERADSTSREEEKRTWNDIMKSLHEPFSVAAAAMDEALQHVGIVLELTPAPKKKKGIDVEASAGVLKPGHPDFSASLKTKMETFYRTRGDSLKAWARKRGLTETDFDSSLLSADAQTDTKSQHQHHRDQQQLYLILYLEHLLYSTGMAVSRLADFADGKVADGTMSRKRLILPGVKRLKKWIRSIGKEDQNIDNETPDNMEEGTHNIVLGPGFGEKKDPEHLPPKNAWQKFGNLLRGFPRFMGSAESSFGFRVAMATFSVAILNYLKQTQRFFMEERLMWAMIIIAIGMTMTSGQSMFGFFGRLAGTTLAMVVSIVIWYIPNQETWGVIILLWFVIFLEMYFFIKFPRFIAVFLITIVTEILIVGYELQVLKIGLAASVASGQRFLPIYQLAPYRLACVAGGSFIAFFWTLFPYPISDRSWLRKDLGSTLFLLANFYSIVHATVHARIHGTEGDMSSKHSPGRKLEKARTKVFGKLLTLLPSLSMHAEWQKWELTIGGNFPRETYEKIIISSTNIMRYLALISYATNNLSADEKGTRTNQESDPATRLQWLHDFSALTDKIAPTSHQFTSTLALLSASVRTGSALPPYIQLPEPFNLTRRLEAIDKGILSVEHAEEPGYSAYAVMQVASTLIGDDLRRLVEHVKELVGETNFEFTPLSDEVNGKGKRD